MICEFQKQHELDYAAKSAAVLKQVADRRKAMNEKNARTALGLDHMTRQYLSVTDRSACPERLFSSVGLVKSDLWGRLLDTTLIDVMWAKQAP